jgi:hypothetical protein
MLAPNLLRNTWGVASLLMNLKQQQLQAQRLNTTTMTMVSSFCSLF